MRETDNQEWDWDAIAAEAKLAYARTGGKMEWKNLVSLIMDLAGGQDGTRPASDSTAEALAADIRREWARFIGQPEN